MVTFRFVVHNTIQYRHPRNLIVPIYVPLPRPAKPILNILPPNPSAPAPDGDDGRFWPPDGASLRSPISPSLGSKDGWSSAEVLSSYTSFSGSKQTTNAPVCHPAAVAAKQNLRPPGLGPWLKCTGEGEATLGGSRGPQSERRDCISCDSAEYPPGVPKGSLVGTPSPSAP